MSPASLMALAEASEQFGDGSLGLTSRGNLQIRGVAPGAADRLAGAVRAVGLLPSLTHERVRNIVASPWGGRSASSRDRIDALVADLDVALCLRPGLADLPGRFLFAVDDGSGDVAGLGADVVLQAMGDGLIAVRVPGGSASAEGAGSGAGSAVDDRSAALAVAACGFVVPEIHAVAAALALAEAFLAERAADDSTAWRIAELPDGPARVQARVVADFVRHPGQPDASRVDDHEEMVVKTAGNGVENDQKAVLVVAGASAWTAPGIVDQVDGLVGVAALAPLGVLGPDQVRAVAAAAGLSSAEPAAALRVTPWRGIVIRDLEIPAALAARELLSAYGLVVDDGTAWNRVTACAGRPGCAKALADVRSDAADFVAAAASASVPLPLASQALPPAPVSSSPSSGGAVHWAGCARGCGTPSGPVAVAIATGSGYELRDGGGLSTQERAWIGAR